MASIKIHWHFLINSILGPAELVDLIIRIYRSPRHGSSGTPYSLHSLLKASSGCRRLGGVSSVQAVPGSCQREVISSVEAERSRSAAVEEYFGQLVEHVVGMDEAKLGAITGELQDGGMFEEARSLTILTEVV